jgi:hypothetical protein
MHPQRPTVYESPASDAGRLRDLESRNGRRAPAGSESGVVGVPNDLPSATNPVAAL